MVQPSSSNLDDQQLPQEIGVCQELNTGSSNEGTMQGASAGRDSNQIDGNNNHIITQIENQTVYIVPNEGKGPHTISLLPKNSIPRKASRLLYGHILIWASLMLVSSLSGTVITAPPDRSLLGKDKPHLVLCNNPSLAEKPETLRIAIADFARSDEIQSSNRQMENFLLQQLPQRIPMELKNQVIVCRLPQAFDNDREAKDAGKSFDAAVVIWGSITSEGFSGGVEVTKPDAILSYSLPLFTLQETQNPTFKEQEMLPTVDFLTKVALSQAYYIDNKFSPARWILKTALEEANNTGKTAKNIHQYLVKSYIGLGAMYENPDPECINPSNCKKAIEAYQKAIKLDSTKSNYFLFIKIGVIYESLKKPEKAREAYSQIIEPPSPYINDGLVNRAILSAKSNREAAEADFEQLISRDPKLGYTSRAEVRLEFWNDVQGAINDSKLLLKEEPNNPNNYHLLGLSQLQAGSMGIAEAKQTYHQLLCYLTDNETRDSIISELNNLAGKQPQIKPDIANIIAFIQVYQISSETTTTCN